MKTIYAALMLALSLNACANETSLIDQFFGKNGISNKKEVYTGEMLKYLDRPTLGESLPPSAKLEHRLVGNAGNSVVYSIDWFKYSTRRYTGRPTYHCFTNKTVYCEVNGFLFLSAYLCTLFKTSLLT
jgi:hypothetical protein